MVCLDKRALQKRLRNMSAEVRHFAQYVDML
jgi:hypothetical protein